MSAGDGLPLREPADAAARAPDLVERLGRHLPATGMHVIHDLGCGTGGMGRWLAPLLPGPQHWVVHDRDADLLEVAVADLPGAAADGAAVTVEARQSDITRLQADELDGATLITASALLDMLTRDELAGRRACVPLRGARPAHPVGRRSRRAHSPGSTRRPGGRGLRRAPAP